jgi:hypothetical protein
MADRTIRKTRPGMDAYQGRLEWPGRDFYSTESLDFQPGAEPRRLSVYEVKIKKRRRIVKFRLIGLLGGGNGSDPVRHPQKA